jgi:hypothetical protein
MAGLIPWTAPSARSASHGSEAITSIGFPTRPVPRDADASRGRAGGGPTYE